MKIDIEQTTVTGPSAIRLSHGNDSMVWDTSAYSKSSDHKSPMNPQLIFQELNGFWASMPLKSQEKFWNLYLEARQALDTLFDIRDLREALQDIAKRIFEIEELEHIDHWVKHRSGIRLPADLKESFEDIVDVVDYPHRKEKTYLKGEYVALATMVIQFRLMVPIWSEFIRNTRKAVGGNSKELEAFRLLYRSRIHNSPALHRLQEYVQVTVKTLIGGELPATVILNGMSETELVDWMLATCIVRRLAMCPISVNDDVSNIITNVYQYVRLGVQGAPKKHGKKFGGRVNLRPPNEIGEERGKRAVAEINKVKQEIPDGIKVFLNVYADNPYRVLLRALGLTRKGSHELTGPIPEGLENRFNQCLTTIDKIPGFEVEKHQETLIQYTLSNVFPPKGVPLLWYDTIKTMAAITQCVLWEWGFYDLAALMTAQRVVVDEDAMIGAPETRGRIPKELMDEQAIRWPYNQPSKGKQSFRQSNVAAKAVDILSDMMAETDWELFCPPALSAMVERSTRGRRMVVPPDIRSVLSHLLIKIYDQQKELANEEV